MFNLAAHHSDTAVLLVREALGTFFAISGYHKCFYAPTRNKITGLFNRLGVAWARWPVTLGEFFGGLALIGGFLTAPASVGLLVIMFGAFKLDTWALIKAKQPCDPCDWVAKTICTPEGLLIVGLLAVIAGGLNPYSIDALLF